MLALSDQHLKVSDTPPCPLGDSQPVSKDKYNPPTEAISDEDVPESSEKYFRSTESDSRKDILSEVLKQTNVIKPETVSIYVKIYDIHKDFQFKINTFVHLIFFCLFLSYISLL